jgi:dienelactone hydrolase
MRSDSKSWRSKLPRKLSNGLAAMAALFMMCGYAEALAASDRVPAPIDPAAQIFGPSSAFQAPQDLTFRVVTILSDGVRLHGELFYPTKPSDHALPTVIMAHGWGGVAAGLRRDAIELARAGYLVLVFDYRGWGESDSRVILTTAEPPGTGNNKFTAEVQAIRGYIDPLEQVEDWFNAIDWAMAEPMVDPHRVGLRGTSYSGGHVVFVAGRDPRIKAIVSQVGGIADRPDFSTLGTNPRLAANLDRAHGAGTQLARGEIGYPDPKVKAIGNLIGAPVGDKRLRWWPNDESSHVTAAALFILAGNEELVDNRTNGHLAHDRVRGPKQLVTIPGITHYGIYGAAREQAIHLAIQWFDKYLKP